MNIGLINYKNKSKDNSNAVNKLFDLIGKFFEPHHKRKNADATAYELSTMAKAVEANSDTFDKLEYKDSKLSFTKKAVRKEEEHIGFINQSKPLEIQERAILRQRIRIIKEQQNFEEIIEKTIHQLDGIEDVSDKEVDNDWLTKFLNSAENISNEDMQNLWAKILAGEVVKPGSFSIRTLKLVESLSQEDAKIIEKIASRRISCLGTDFILSLTNSGIEDIYNSNFDEILLLKELGILAQTDLQYTLNPNGINSKVYLSIGKYEFLQITTNDPSKQVFKNLSFTTNGKEIIKLIDMVEPDVTYIQLLTYVLGKKNRTFYYREQDSKTESNQSDMKEFNNFEYDKGVFIRYIK